MLGGQADAADLPPPCWCTLRTASCHLQNRHHPLFAAQISQTRGMNLVLRWVELGQLENREQETLKKRRERYNIIDQSLHWYDYDTYFFEWEVQLGICPDVRCIL